MSLSSFESEEPRPQDADSPPADSPTLETPNGWTIASLIAHDGVEPAAAVSDGEALASWAAVTAPWHPSILAELGSVPKLESVEAPTPPATKEIRIVAEGQADRLPSGFRAQCEEAGAVLVEAGSDRDALVEILRSHVGGASHEEDESKNVAMDYLSLGTAQWMLRDLTNGMGHADCLDHEGLARESLAGARSWKSGDAATARNHLRAAFELLTEARERFYPVDSYIVDICLLDPAMPAGAMNDALDAKAPVTFLAPALAFANQAERDPENMARLRAGIGEGWADVAGGAYSEAEEPLLPLESILWQFQHGSKVYREHLDERNVESLARRRFGLYPMLPQIGKRFGFRFAVHLGFDAGRFPVRPETKRLWESPDHTNLETLTRPPLAADRPASGLALPWRMALSMKDDHVAAVPLVHWPSQLAGWHRDLRRTVAYSPVLGRWVTLNDFFHLTDRPFETFGPGPDDYVTPYLAQAVARSDEAPVSAKATHAALRARVDALASLRAIAEILGHVTEESVDASPGAAELAETGRFAEAKARLDALEPEWASAVAAKLSGEGRDGRPGYLVLNPSGVARRAVVTLEDAAPDLRAEGPLRAAQFTAEGVVAVVDVPAFGFAWIPKDTNFEASPAPIGAVGAKDATLHNETLNVEIDRATGGIRGIRAAGEETSRLGQQLVINGLAAPDGSPASSRMKASSYEVEYAGPALVQAVSSGTLAGPDGRPLARFQQRVSLWSDRPTCEINIELSDLDGQWLASLANADPWARNLSCRWAWPDSSAMLRRTSLLSPELTEAARPETPDAIDISTRRQRTALLFGGLAHHQRHGNRMLDTILVAGKEQARSFRLGVVLDLEHLFHASVDLTAPAHVVETKSGPPASGPTGWLFQVDHKGVAITSVTYVPSTDDGRGWGLAFHLLETSGHPARCRLRLFRDPSWARQTDFQNEVLVDLPISGDAVLVDLTPHELARVEVTMG